MWKLRCLGHCGEVALRCGGVKCMGKYCYGGVMVCGGCDVSGMCYGGVAVWGCCGVGCLSVGEFWCGEVTLRRGEVAVCVGCNVELSGSCSVGKSRFEGVSLKGSCGVWQLWCGGIAL